MTRSGKSNRRSERLYQDGWLAGWGEYRYGCIRTGTRTYVIKDRITLAGPPRHPPILRGESLRAAVDRTVEVMRDWRFTPFENEGTVRAAIRSAFCLQQYGWHRADQQAAAIVAEALRLMGAKRPTWEQGQRHYTIARETCRQCGGQLDEEQITYGDRFCSGECARIAITRRSFQHHDERDRLYRRALKIIRISRKPVKECAQCGKEFQQRGENGDGKFCSMRCYQANLKQRAPSVRKQCLYCGTHFLAKHPKAAYCQEECKVRAAVIRRPNGVTRLSPPVIDYLFRRQGLRITEERIAT